jgi:hypothetical protein
MAYTINLPQAAQRHMRDGNTLLASKSAQHAGYHFGFAIECAIKSVLFRYGFRSAETRRSDPYWAHFPALRTLLLRDGRGRLSQKLYDAVSHDSFMQNWDTDMRYASNQAVSEEQARKWQAQAADVFGLVFF